MIDLLLKDNTNKKMQELHNLTELVEGIVYNNLFELNKNGNKLSLESLTSETTDYWEKQGYETDDTLYNSLVAIYNENNPDPLQIWSKL